MFVIPYLQRIVFNLDIYWIAKRMRAPTDTRSKVAREFMENIKAFNLITGDLFAKLYQNFPAYVEFDYFSLSTGLVSKDDYNLAWKMSDFAKATVDWLTDEGYIWIKPPQYGPMKT